MADSVRVALIGCGRHGGSRLAPAIRATDGLELTAFVDSDPRAAHHVAQGSGEIFTDVPTFIAAGVAEAAVIAVPHDVLADTTLACIGTGLHVLVEKPVARDRTEARQVLDAALERNVVLMPAYCLRFAEVRTRLRDLLWRGLAGRIVAITAGKGSPPLEGWLADPARGGGQLAFLGSHLIDQVLWLHRGRVRQVSAQISERDDTGADATTSAVLTFEDGVSAGLLITQSSGVAFDYIEISGDAGRVRSDWKANSLTVESTEGRDYRAPVTVHVRDDPMQPMYDAELAEFAGAIHGGREPSVTGMDAVRVLAVLDAIRESGASGATVAVDDPWEGQATAVAAHRGPAQVPLQFTFPADMIQMPFVYELSRRFMLKFDVRRADVDAGIGWVQLVLEGDRAEIDAAVQWAEQQGVKVDPVGGDVVGG